jgi:spore coat polysaccharide biosynthesis predicted glycosyltransferase SpsG
MGHISRCTRIARAVEAKGHRVIFVIGKHSVKPDGTTFRVNGEGYEQLFKRLKPDIIVVDMLDTDLKFMQTARKHCKKLISFDDLGKGASIADFTINGNLCGGTYSGAKYIVVHPELNLEKRSVSSKCRRVILSFGGYDHLKLFDKTKNALKRLNMIPVAPTKKYYAKALRNSGMAITNCGLSMFDAMAVGTPVIAIAQYEHQRKVGSMYGHAVRFIGKGDEIHEGDILKEVVRLRNNRNERRNMSEMSQKIIDGKGLERVVELILGDTGWR